MSHLKRGKEKMGNPDRSDTSGLAEKLRGTLMLLDWTRQLVNAALQELGSQLPEDEQIAQHRGRRPRRRHVPHK